jgi:hypothetical protein
MFNFTRRKLIIQYLGTFFIDLITSAWKQFVKSLSLSYKENATIKPKHEYHLIPNKEIVFRQNKPVNTFLRPIMFLSAPWIRFLHEFVGFFFKFYIQQSNHFYFKIAYVCYVLFLDYFILFDYYPQNESSTISVSEILIIIWVLISQLERTIAVF